MMERQYLPVAPQVSPVKHVNPLGIQQEDVEALHYPPLKFHYR